MGKKSIVALLSIAALLGSAFTGASAFEEAPPAQAVVANEFNPGYLISDEKFYDGTAMSAGQIQSFLNSRVPVCRSGYICLKDFRQDTYSRSADRMCAAYIGAPNETAAEIVFKVGSVCGISQEALLALLEKEQSLISDTWPLGSQYRSATGYGCPDTAPCDAQYYGFYNQVYKAAWQFKYYKANPNSFNHVGGRNNQIRYHPSTSCGSGSVFIQNSATAGLYNYTPYQPNQAALNNIYGLGDACSAYGNRNFWRIFSDWFGSPTGPSSLVRSAGNSTVYLTSGSSKYPISNQAVLAALAPLGPLNFVSDSYLDRFTTQHVATQVLRGPDGSIYFAGSGIKLPFTSCETVGHYGGSCASNGYVQLDASQISKFASGPYLSRIMGTTEGSRYFMENGAKREILDDQSQTAAGISGDLNVLTESALSAIPFGMPVARGSVVVSRFDSDSIVLLDELLRTWDLASSEANSMGLTNRSTGRLREASIDKLSAAEGLFVGLLSDPSGQVFGLTGEGKFRWTPEGGAAVTATPVSASFLEAFITTGEIGVGNFVKASGDATIYLISDKSIRPIGSWETLVSMSELGNPHYSVIPRALIDSIPSGPIALEAATLVRSSSDATVYLVNGITNKTPLSSFDPVAEAGITRFSFTWQDRIDAYPTNDRVLEYGMLCGAERYLAAGGAIHAVADDLYSHFPFSYVELDQYVCRQLKVGIDATAFIRTSDGSIYQILNGEKRPISSMQRLAQLDSLGSGYLQVSDRFAALVPTGALA